MADECSKDYAFLAGFILSLAARRVVIVLLAGASLYVHLVVVHVRSEICITGDGAICAAGIDEGRNGPLIVYLCIWMHPLYGLGLV